MKLSVIATQISAASGVRKEGQIIQAPPNTKSTMRAILPSSTLAQPRVVYTQTITSPKVSTMPPTLPNKEGKGIQVPTGKVTGGPKGSDTLLDSSLALLTSTVQTRIKQVLGKSESEAAAGSQSASASQHIGTQTLPPSTTSQFSHPHSSWTNPTAKIPTSTSAAHINPTPTASVVTAMPFSSSKGPRASPQRSTISIGTSTEKLEDQQESRGLKFNRKMILRVPPLVPISKSQTSTGSAVSHGVQTDHIARTEVTAVNVPAVKHLHFETTENRPKGSRRQLTFSQVRPEEVQVLDKPSAGVVSVSQGGRVEPTMMQPGGRWGSDHDDQSSQLSQESDWESEGERENCHCSSEGTISVLNSHAEVLSMHVVCSHLPSWPQGTRSW